MSDLTLADLDDQVRQLLPALEQIGAVPILVTTIPQSGEQADLLALRWRDRVIQITNGIREGLTCRIGPPGSAPAEDNDWPSIFSYTVANFDDFDTNQQIDWIVSVPKGPAYPGFLAQHILRLPQAIG